MISRSRAKSTSAVMTDFGVIAPVGLLGLLMMIILVFSLTRLLRSSISGMYFCSLLNFHNETSAPRLSGTEYNC